MRVLHTDFDWEVKLKSAGFWLQLIDRSASEQYWSAKDQDRSASEQDRSAKDQDRRRFLADHWFYTALQGVIYIYISPNAKT